MTLLAIGDVCGEPGLRCCERHLRALRRDYGADICVVNGENADVLGILPAQARRLTEAGADFVTLGNHTCRKRQIIPYLDEEPRLLRPANYGEAMPGRGFAVTTLRGGKRLCVANLLGRLNCDWNTESPFAALDRLIAAAGAELYAVDFHAEATSEKAALAYYADGRVCVLFGTHTHVQTSDERVLRGGLGFITDLGMCGAADSVLGVEPEQSVAYFTGGPPSQYRCPSGQAVIEGAVFTVDEASTRCAAVERIRLRV